MKLHLITIGQHMPAWVTTGYQEYAKRLPRECSLILHELPMPKRHKNNVIAQLKQQETELILKTIPERAYIIALDEHGIACSTQTLAQDFANWLNLGTDVVFIIGGPDGLEDSILKKANKVLSLSSLTLPHPLVRVVVAEQLYRAWSLLNNHPYHR